MRKKDDDLLHYAVVAVALAVLAVVVWTGGKRLYRGWRAGRPAVVRPPPERPAQDGVDRPPSFIPPLALSGVQPQPAPARPPAARPKPAITPDRAEKVD